MTKLIDILVPDSLRLDEMIEAFQAGGGTLPGGVRHDADGGTVFFKRQLEYVLRRVLETVFPEITFMRHIPVSTEVRPGATSLTYRRMTEIGLAEILAPKANDPPVIELGGDETTVPIRILADAFIFTIFEIQSARFANVNLETRKATAARRAIDRLHNRIAYYGHPTYNLGGLLTDPGITAVAAPDPGSGTEWEFKTAAEIVNDITILIETVRDQSKDTKAVRNILIPGKQHGRIATLQNSDASDVTVLKYVLANFPDLDSIESLPEAAASFTDNPFPEDIMFGYDRTPEVVEYHMPSPVRPEPVQRRNFELVTNLSSRSGGTAVYEPLACAIVEGI